MTKRDLVKWLERKWNGAISSVDNEYYTSLSTAKEDLCCELGFDKAAEEMQELIEKAQNIWNGFKSKCEAMEAVSFRNGYLSPDSRLYEYIGKEGKTFQCLLNNEIRVETESMLNAKGAYNDLTANIKKNYQNVIATVQSLKNVKEAVEYLTTLGFDLSELGKAPEPVTALAVQIDTSYLFLKKAA